MHSPGNQSLLSEVTVFFLVQVFLDELNFICVSRSELTRMLRKVGEATIIA
jgi:hypothetical protein